VLAEYARRMPFQSWHPPQAATLELRTITRHIAALTQQHTRQSNRLHAVSASATGSRCVQQDLKRSLRDLERPDRKNASRRTGRDGTGPRTASAFRAAGERAWHR
jgi:hypothetical protein